MSTPANTRTEGRQLFARELHIFIQAPCEEVFQYIADITRHPEWAGNPLEIRHIAGPPSGPGAIFESVARRAARVAGTFTARIRIIEAESPLRLVYEVEDNTGHYRWTMRLRPEKNGTLLTQRMAKLRGPWLINIIQPLFIWRQIGRPQVQGGLENIKARLEKAK